MATKVLYRDTAHAAKCHELAGSASFAGSPAKAGQKSSHIRDNAVGSDIRALRKSRSMTLQVLADKLGRSVGFISQVERGLSEPSISDLRQIADFFHVPISLFFGSADADPVEKGYVVRAGARRRLGGDGELVEELLSPDLGGNFEIIRSEFAPNTELRDAVQRDTEEAGYVIAGRLDLHIGGKWFELTPGDSFRFTAEPYRWRNRGNEIAVVIWVISPPVY